MKKITFLVLLTTIFCFNSFGQSSGSNYFTIERVEKGEYAIPLIKSEHHSNVANKINQIIQMSQVYKSYNVVGDKLFTEMQDENGYGKTYLDYEILQNSSSILSIKFTDETMTAYPDYHTAYLNFNSSTGDIIDLFELLNKSGVNHLNDISSEIFNKSIRSYHNDVVSDNSLGIEEQKEEFELIFKLIDCNATHDIWKFGIKPDVIVVEKDRCFPHVIQAMDISWKCEIETKKLWDSDFTLFGKNLLRKNIQDKSLHYIQKVNLMTIHGKIDNKYSFNMFLRINNDNSIGGLYWYTKFGKLLDFSGKKVAHNRIELNESGGKFDLILNDDGSITGTWFNNQGKSFPIIFD